MLSVILPSDANKILAERIKALRLEKSWTREELASRSGVNKHSITHFEQSGQISLERFLQLSFALGRFLDFNDCLKPAESLSIKTLATPNKRQRGKRKQHD